jgi:F-type H+-transporting ATPase subunit a
MRHPYKSVLCLLLAGAGINPAHAGDAVSPSPYVLIHDSGFFGFPITNSMVTGWVISIFLIIAVRLMAWRPQLIPGAGQAVIETLLTGLHDLLEPIVGRRMIRIVFPLLLSLFVFILIHNWSGLLPGVGAFGFYDASGHLKYWFRPGNADLNMTIALALVAAIGSWLYFVLRYAGIKVLLHDLFGNKADAREMPKAIYVLLFPIFFAVGLVEVVSILFRPVSLSFRLYGNIFGGENLLTNIIGLAGWIVPIPFYFLEMLIGFVQALVFTLLTAVYIGLICNHEEADPAH